MYVGVRNARLVLADNDGIRATMTAHWLMQMGWEAAVLANAFAGQAMVAGDPPTEILGGAPTAPTVAPKALKAMLDRGEAVVIDIDTSLRYRAGHVPGAWFAVRANLAEALKKVPAAALTVLTSSDGLFARLAVPEVEAQGRKAAALAGGTRAWLADGLPMATGFENMADPPKDVWYRPYDRDDGVEAAMRQYLDWEVDLVGQVERDGDARFRVVRPS
jgi:rhodanese-related sulfurtransferase